MNARRSWKEGKRRTLVVALALLLALLTTMPGMAQTGPNTMSFQGRLLDSSGEPRSGEKHCMRFRICSDSSCSTQVWPGGSRYEEHDVITESGTYKAGLFSVSLGTTYLIPPTLMVDHDKLYVEVGVADDANCPGSSWTPMTPRSQIRTSAYAQRSRRVHTQESDDDYLVKVENTGQGGGVYAATDSTTVNAKAGYFHAAGNSGKTYGVYAQNDSTTFDAKAGSFWASGAIGLTSGVYAQNDSTQDGARAGHFVANGSTGATHSVYGLNVSTDDDARAGYFYAGGNSGATHGVYGKNDSTTDDARAGTFSADGTSGRTYGVYAENQSTDGVGVYGTAPLTGVVGIASATSAATGVAYGVYGEIVSTVGSAGRFIAKAASGMNHGVYGETNSTHDWASAGNFFADSDSGDADAVYAANDSTGAAAYAVYAAKTRCTGNQEYCHSIYTPDRMYAHAFDASGSDVAEYYPTDQALDPGDVVMADPSGGGRLVLAEGAYNTAVLGVISTDPGIALGSGEDVGQALLALIGRVPVKASAENGAIRPGDLLVTSSTPGHAMRCEGVEQCFGRTIGKALEELESGSGVILMLVTLQ